MKLAELQATLNGLGLVEIPTSMGPPTIAYVTLQAVTDTPRPWPVYPVKVIGDEGFMLAQLGAAVSELAGMVALKAIEQAAGGPVQIRQQ